MTKNKNIKNRFIKYSKAELESYVIDKGSCVKKVEMEELVRYSPTALMNLQKTILEQLGKKIGKYDYRLEGVVLDFRNTKILSLESRIRQDSIHSALKIRTNWYVFSPKRDALVTGIVKFINKFAMETVISVVIYRVFNVKITIKGVIKKEIEKDQEIKIRLKSFHFENVVPYVEGEIVDLESLKVKTNSPKNFERTSDSGVSMDDCCYDGKIKTEKLSSDDEVEPSEIHQSTKRVLKRKLKFEDVKSVTKKIKVEPQSDVEVKSLNIKEEKLSQGEIMPSKKKKKKSKKSFDFDATIESLLNSTV